MSIPVPDFWRLVIESQLLPAAECQRLGEQFGHVKGAAAQGNARTLSEWLISQNVISRYQSTILLAGRAGPFIYDDYKIYDRIEGGPLTGQFKAVHAITGHPVLLKFFAGETVSDPQRFSATADRAWSHTKLVHPHWWRSFELVNLEQFKFLVIADVSGQSVARRLETGQRIPFPEACRLAYQAALALARAHEAGFIHGNVRPGNLVIDGQGRAVLWCDPCAPPAGIATTAADEATLTRADYAAPELATAGKTADALCDVYALGCTLYQMLSGAAPFAGGDARQKMQRHATEAIQPLAPLGVPELLEKTVAYMMAKNASVRYQSASQAADQLGQFLESSERQPKVAPAPATLAALEQHLKQKPQPTPARAVVSVNSPSPSGPQYGGATNAPILINAPGAFVTSSPVLPSAPVATTPGVVPVSPAPTVQRGVHVGNASLAGVASGATVGAVASSASSVAGASASERFTKKKPLSKNTPLLIMLGGGIAFLLTLGILAAAGLFSGNPNDVAQADGGEDGGATDGRAADGVDTSDGEDPAADGDDGAEVDGGEPAGGNDATPRYDIAATDDGQSLWAPPTAGEPVDLAFAPGGARVYIIVRPSEILASGHGGNVLKALGPDFQTLRDNWRRAAGVTLDEVEKLVIGIHPNNSMQPRFSQTVTLKAPLDIKARWNNPSPAGGANVFTVAGKKAWLPPGGGGRVFVMGAAEEIDALAASGVEKPRPPLDPFFSQLAKSSDGEQQFVAIFDPQFFHTDGRDMFRGPYEKLIEPLDWFFGDDTKAMVSMNFKGDFFAELRLYSRLQKTPSDMRQEYGGRIDELPNKFRRYILSLNPPPYWKEVWFNFPDMVNLVKSQTRRGVEGEEVVFNFILPGHTAPNLIAASELSIASSPGASYDPGNTGPTPTAKPTPKTLEDLLTAKVDLGFPQQSLEFSMRDLVAAAKDEYPELPIDFQIKISGADLQKEGITRNQQIRDFDAKATPIRDVLTQLVRKANPVTTVTDPSETDQKLVWLIGPDPDDASKKIVLITTRTAAASKNLTLPAVFQPK